MIPFDDGEGHEPPSAEPASGALKEQGTVQRSAQVGSESDDPDPAEVPAAPVSTPSSRTRIQPSAQPPSRQNEADKAGDGAARDSDTSHDSAYDEDFDTETEAGSQAGDPEHRPSTTGTAGRTTAKPPSGARPGSMRSTGNQHPRAQRAGPRPATRDSMVSQSTYGDDEFESEDEPE